MILAIELASWRRPQRTSDRRQTDGVGLRLPVILAAVVGLAGIVSMLIPTKPELRTDRLGRDTQDREVFEAAARGSGILATAPDLWLVQLRTRRPVLLDVASLDTLAYAMEGAPLAERVLQDVYKLSLFAAPSSGDVGQISRANALEAWSRLSIDDWKAIGDRHGVTEVLVHRDWPLALPTLAVGATLKLSRIPD